MCLNCLTFLDNWIGWLGFFPRMISYDGNMSENAVLKIIIGFLMILVLALVGGNSSSYPDTKKRKRKSSLGRKKVSCHYIQKIDLLDVRVL